MSTKTFHRGTAEQLSDFLRESILRGELSNPLPPTRVWCQQLNVGRPNLLRALQMLEHDGYITITARGAVITDKKVLGKRKDFSSQRVARLLFLGRNYPDMEQNIKWLFLFSEGLHRRGINLSVERCSSQRLRTIAKQTDNGSELYFLASLPVIYQRLFMERKKPSIVIGYSGSDISLPFLTPDLANSVRHAAQSLLRRGFKRLVLLNVASREAGDVEGVRKFQAACAEWRHQPIKCEVKIIWNNLTSMRLAINRLAASVKEPCGFIVLQPVPVGVLATALLQNEISIPKQAEIVAIEYSPRETQFSVPVTLYGVPSRRYAKELLQATTQYFETGKMPSIRKILLMDAAEI